jgi:hypothetical protein
MPISYRIDSSRGLVLTEAWGILTDADILDHKDRLLKDPAFDPSMAQLSDVRRVEDLRVTRNGVAAMIQHDVGNAAYREGHRLAIVISLEVAFGMARMYQIMSEQRENAVGVFRTMHEAMAWLALE